jgi:hypothetical protein
MVVTTGVFMGKLGEVTDEAVGKLHVLGWLDGRSA